MNVTSLYPSNVIIKHDYIKINNYYITSIILSDLPDKISMLEIMKIIPQDIENIVSIYFSKKNINDEIKRLSKVILESSSEIKSLNNNLISKDMLRKINIEASELRRKLQVENEDIYGVNLCISISDINLENLKLNINKIISSLYANNVFCKIANFRQDIVYFNTLPLNRVDEKFKCQTDINITTSQAAYLIPYIKNDVYYRKGIFYGYINKSFCIYDVFSKSNMNHNMCILGSSGAGKSYFIKTIILRNFCMNIRQIIFDIEEEYLNLSNNTNTIEFNISNFNIMYIPRVFVENNYNNFLDKKINNIFKVLQNIVGQRINNYEDKIKKELSDIYQEFGVTNSVESLYKYEDNGIINVNKEYKKYSSFPNLNELVNRLENNNKIPKSIIKDIRNHDINKKYDIDEAKKIDNRFDSIIVFNMKSLNICNFSIFINFAEEYYGEKLLIYIDEVWKFINENIKDNVCEKIAELYKTIRKKNAGIVVISQDIHDILRYEDGIFGKSILNNSFTKLFFKMQYLDLAVLGEIGICNKEILIGIKRLIKGSAYMCIGDVSFSIDIRASNFEKQTIGGETFEKSFSSNR